MLSAALLLLGTNELNSRQNEASESGLSRAAARGNLPVGASGQEAELHKVISQGIILPVHHVQRGTYKAPAYAKPMSTIGTI